VSKENNGIAELLRAFAVEAEKMPATGTVEAATVLALMNEAISILNLTLAETGKHVAIGTELAGRCSLLYDQLIELRTERVWERPGATA